MVIMYYEHNDIFINFGMEGHTMSHNRTNRSERSDLTPQQMTAIERLLAGGTITASAEAAGVTRETVHRWKKSDWRFQAAMNQRLREYQEATRTKLHSTALRASEVVAEAIDRGNLKAALAILKGIGALEGVAPKIGEEDPEELRLDAQLDADRKNRDRQNQMMATTV